jgi:hypothetical protein
VSQRPTSGRWLLFLFLIVAIALGIWLASAVYRKSGPHDHHLRHITHLQREMRRYEAQQIAFQKALDDKQLSRNQDTLDAYYAFREVEVEDQEAWRLATRKIEGNIAVLSNQVVKVVGQLTKLRSELIAVEEQADDAQPTSK